MSECTGLIATPTLAMGPVVYSIDREALQFNQVVEIENTGKKASSDIKTQVLVLVDCLLMAWSSKIVDPVTRLEILSSHEMGEIWLRGPTCTQGYWNTVDSSLSVLKNGDVHPYIRTGDLGFIKNEELFLVGRLKEIIKLCGKNYYPMDIEMDVKSSHLRILKQLCVAFSATVDNNEELFILQEIEDKLSEQEYESVISSMRRICT